MKFVWFILILMLSQNVAAYTGICFVDAFLNLFDGMWNSVLSIVSPKETTTTTSTTTTSITVPTTSSTSTTSTTSYTTSTSSTLTPTSTTTTLAVSCYDINDCPEKNIIFKCNFQGNVVRITRTYFCANAGSPESLCKSIQKLREIDICGTGEKCVLGQETCVVD